MLTSFQAELKVFDIELASRTAAADTAVPAAVAAVPAAIPAATTVLAAVPAATVVPAAVAATAVAGDVMFSFLSLIYLLPQWRA